ncbi:MAG: hypothetical protein N3F64_02285 [Nitrososphaeria archaeon]|nr:hypothetical protein [Nitrososphaeria archaeon]
MKKILTQIILAFLLATIIMAAPIYFGKQKTMETRLTTEGEYRDIKSQAPAPAAAAIETLQPTTTVDKSRVDYMNIYMMIFISLTISFIITIIFMFIRIRV